MKNITFLALSFLFTGQVLAQCQPTFVNGCFDWHTNTVFVAGIDWAYDQVDCTFSDYTDNFATLEAGGDSVQMTVENGNWSGCSVWIDFDRSGDYDNSENMYHAGNGSEAIHFFDFKIAVPATVAPGDYTMRVITSWGSDGFNVGANGYGACGAYQYGNFQDFTLTVISTGAGLGELKNSFTLFPNPATDKLVIKGKQLLNGKSFSVSDLRGTTLMNGKFENGLNELLVEQLQAGMYVLELENAGEKYTFVKQ